jgi:hypothetical protein
VFNTKKKRVHSPEKKKLKVELFKFPSAYFIEGITSTKDWEKEFFFWCVYSGNFVTIKQNFFFGTFWNETFFIWSKLVRVLNLKVRRIIQYVYLYNLRIIRLLGKSKKRRAQKYTFLPFKMNLVLHRKFVPQTLFFIEQLHQ